MTSPVILPATSRHSATVFFLHGLGGTGSEWVPVFESIRLPHVKYVCPTAPIRPITVRMGARMPAWFNIRGLSISAGEDEEGIKKSAATVHSWLDEEVKSGIPSDRIVLSGASQGGALALYSALTYDKPLGGVVALSCWLPLHQLIRGTHQANKHIPILQCHGDADPLVNIQIASLSAGVLQTLSKNHTLKIYTGMGHSACDQEIQDIKAFQDQRLPPV